MLGDISCSFGTLLKQWRKRQRLTQQRLAAAIQIHRNTIGRWEKGTFVPESKTLIFELARCLRLTERETRQLRDASRTVPALLWSVLYPRNPFFTTGPEELLNRLHGLIGSNQPNSFSQPYALRGLGGIGKTQLTREYTYKHTSKVLCNSLDSGRNE